MSKVNQDNGVDDTTGKQRELTMSTL